LAPKIDCTSIIRRGVCSADDPPSKGLSNGAAMPLWQEQQMIVSVIRLCTRTRRRLVSVCTPGGTVVKPLRRFALFPEYFVYQLWGTTNALHTPLLVPTEATFVVPQCLRLRVRAKGGGGREEGRRPPPPFPLEMNTVFELLIVIYTWMVPTRKGSLRIVREMTPSKNVQRTS
jgi:hypothetical protein